MLVDRPGCGLSPRLDRRYADMGELATFADALAAVEGSERVRRELIIHHTDTDVSDDEAAHIQDIFRVNSQDQRRTEQICQDVHEA